MGGLIGFKNWFFLLLIAIATMVSFGTWKWVLSNSAGIEISNELAPVSKSKALAKDSSDLKPLPKLNAICEEAIERQAGNQLDAKAYCNCALPIYLNYLSPSETQEFLEGIPNDKVPDAACEEIQKCIEESQVPH